MRRLSIQRPVALLALLSALPVARLEGMSPSLLVPLLGLATLRLVLGPRPRALLGRRFLALLGAAAALVTLVLLARMARGGGPLPFWPTSSPSVPAPPPLVQLLALVAVVQTLCLAARPRPFVELTSILLATTHVAGAAFLRQDPVAIGLTALHVAALAPTLVLLERRLASAPRRTGGATVHVVVGDPSRLPPRAGLGAVAGLLLLGLPLGTALYVAVPRDLLARRAGAEAWRAAAAQALSARRDAIRFRTGPDRGLRGITLGDVGRIKRDLTPYFEVRRERGEPPLLQEDSFEVYGNGAWHVARDAPPPRHASSAVDGWVALDATNDRVALDATNDRVALDATDDRVRGEDLRITQLHGNHRRLFLQREAVRVRILRGEVPMAVTLRHHAHGQIECLALLAEGDVIEQRRVAPEHPPSRLLAARSDAGVSPRPGYVVLPESCAPLGTWARRVVGEETRPWARARLLEAWLRGPEFRYRLQMPEVDRRQPVVDFVQRAREGHCEYYASALTLLLRSLGHPARIVRGFRGGDFQRQRGTWIVRASNYHAWTQMWLEGLGWVDLDATPPDREAVDAVTVAHAETAGRTGGGRALEGGAEGAGDRDVLRTWLKGTIDRFVLGPLAPVLTSPAGLAGLVVLLAGALVLVARRRRRGRRTRGPGGASVPVRGPYARALALVARRGVRRQPPQTPREFVAAVARRLPAAAAPLERITAMHERERFAGAPPDRDARRRARAALRDLAGALSRAASERDAVPDAVRGR